MIELFKKLNTLQIFLTRGSLKMTYLTYLHNIKDKDQKEKIIYFIVTAIELTLAFIIDLVAMSIIIKNHMFQKVKNHQIYDLLKRDNRVKNRSIIQKIEKNLDEKLLKFPELLQYYPPKDNKFYRQILKKDIKNLKYIKNPSDETYGFAITLMSTKFNQDFIDSAIFLRNIRKMSDKHRRLILDAVEDNLTTKYRKEFLERF